MLHIKQQQNEKATYKATTKQKGYILSNKKTRLHIKQQKTKKATYKATTKQKGYI